MMRRLLPDLGIMLLLLALPLAFFAPVTLGDRTLLPADNLYQWQPFAAYREVVRAPDVPHNALLSDLILENYVWKQFIRESIAGGEIPLWNPHLFAGVPFLAAGQHSALYPLSVIFYALPLASAYGWYTVIQLWLAGLCMYALARGLGQGRTGATVAAVSWQLSGWFLARVVFPMILGAAAWLPLLLLMVEYIIQERPLRGRPASMPWVAGGAVTLGLVIYAGHVEITYYTLLIAGFYAGARLLSAWWRLRRQAGAGGRLALASRQGLALASWQGLARRAAWLLAMVALGLGLGAAQFLPLFELASQNFRAGSATLEQILGWAYPPRRIIAFLMPNFFGNPAHHAYWDVFSGETVPATVNALGEPIHTIYWGIKNYVEGGAYLGILPMALAAFGLVAAWGGRRQAQGTGGPPYRGILAALGALSLTFIFGLPTYALLYYLLPFINQLHSPFRWVFALTLAVAALAGYGADALAARAGQGDSEGARLRRWAGVFGWGLVGAGVAVLAGLGLSRLLYPQIEPLVERVFRALALAEQAFADARMFYSYQFRNVLLLGVFLVAGGGVFLASRTRLRLPRRLGGRAAWQGLALAVIALDLMVAFWGFNPAADPALLDFTPPALEWLQGQYAQHGPFRITTLDAPGAATMNANIPWMFGLEDVRGYDSIIPKRYTDFMALISPQFQLEFNRVAPLTTDHPEALGSELLNLLNVRYLVTETAVNNPIWELVYEDEAVRIYENRHVLPRAFTLPERATLTYDKPEAFGHLVEQPGIDPRIAVLLYDPEGVTSTEGALLDAEPVPQRITEHRNIQVTVEVTAAEPSWLVLADSYFEGWRAFIRPAGAGEEAEVEVPVRLVDGNFRGVFIDPEALAERYAQEGDSGQVTPADRWLVRFRYSPASFQVGAFVSFIAGAVILFGVGVWLWRSLYVAREEGEAGTMRRLAKNSVMPIVINLFNKGIDFAFAFIMLRVLGPEGAGIYYYAIVVYLWFEILTNFGLNTYLTREVARRREQAGRYLLNTSALRLALAALGVPLLVGFLLARQEFVSPPLDPTAMVAIGLLYAGLLPNSLSTGLSALFYAFEQAEYPAAVSTVGTISKAVLGLGALLLGWGVIGLAGASILTNLIVLGVLLWAARPLIWPEGRSFRLQVARPEGPLLRHMIFESWPLMINHLLATLFFKVDVILIEAINGVNVVGWYSTAYKWLDALNIIPAFLSAALLPVMSRQAQEDPPALVRSYRLSVKLLVMVALPVAVVTTFVARTLILVLGGAEFLPDGAVALQLMIWSIPIGWVNSVTQYVLIALDQQRVLTRAFLAAVIFNVAANLVFLPLYSYRAAAVITFFSEALLLGLFLQVLRRTLRARIPADAEARAISLWGLVWRPGLAGAAMLGAMAALWGVNGGLALALQQGLAVLAGVVIYVAVVAALRPFDAVERAQLALLLPERLQARASAAAGGE